MIDIPKEGARGMVVGIHSSMFRREVELLLAPGVTFQKNGNLYIKYSRQPSGRGDGDGKPVDSSSSAPPLRKTYFACFSDSECASLLGSSAGDEAGGADVVPICRRKDLQDGEFCLRGFYLEYSEDPAADPATAEGTGDRGPAGEQDEGDKAMAAPVETDDPAHSSGEEKVKQVELVEWCLQGCNQEGEADEKAKLLAPEIVERVYDRRLAWAKFISKEEGRRSVPLSLSLSLSLSLQGGSNPGRASTARTYGEVPDSELLLSYSPFIPPCWRDGLELPRGRTTKVL